MVHLTRSGFFLRATALSRIWSVPSITRRTAPSLSLQNQKPCKIFPAPPLVSATESLVSTTRLFLILLAKTIIFFPVGARIFLFLIARKMHYAAKNAGKNGCREKCEQRTSMRKFCKRDSIENRTAAARLPLSELHSHPMAFQDAVRRAGYCPVGGVDDCAQNAFQAGHL